MATFAELKDRADTLIQDSSLTSSLGDFINQGVSEIAGGMQSSLTSTITPPLPDLFTIDTVTIDTTQAYVDMPSTFQRTLQFVTLATGSEVDISESFIEFAETYPLLDKVGKISEVIEHGNKLYYQGIPTAEEDLTIHFYRKPVDMVADGDTPDGIPEHLQISLLTNFAAWKAYEFIEDGLEGETPNTQKFMGFFFNDLKTLELSIPDYTRGLKLR